MIPPLICGHDEQVPSEPYFARRAHPLWISQLLYCVYSKSQRHIDLKLVQILIRVMHLLFTDKLKNLSCNLCLPFMIKEHFKHYLSVIC